MNITTKPLKDRTYRYADGQYVLKRHGVYNESTRIGTVLEYHWGNKVFFDAKRIAPTKNGDGILVVSSGVIQRRKTFAAALRLVTETRWRTGWPLPTK